MSGLSPRLRMFAGPNGSGKTTIQRNIAEHFPADFLGVLVNPDDLEAGVKRDCVLNLHDFGITASAGEVQQALVTSQFLQKEG